jgi:hypothetical protein
LTIGAPIIHTGVYERDARAGSEERSGLSSPHFRSSQREVAL